MYNIQCSQIVVVLHKSVRVIWEQYYLVFEEPAQIERKWAFHFHTIPFPINLLVVVGITLCPAGAPVLRSTRGQGWVTSGSQAADSKRPLTPRWPKLPELWVTRTGAPAGYNVIPYTTLVYAYMTLPFDTLVVDFQSISWKVTQTLIVEWSWIWKEVHFKCCTSSVLVDNLDEN